MKRNGSAYESHPTQADGASMSRAVDVMVGDALADFVEMVAWCPQNDVFEARAVDGSVRFRRYRTGSGFEYGVEATSGRNPLDNQDPTHLSPLQSEISQLRPDRSRNSYPFAYEHIAQIFDHACAPDIVGIHTGAHRYEENIGNHGSLGVIQARAPLVACGPGIASLGLVDGHCRLVDIAPTILELLGVPTCAGTGPNGLPSTEGVYLARQDGRVITEILDPSGVRPHRVLGFLLDGCNANVLYDAVASGGAPNIARLVAKGTALAHGAFSTLPTVTLANHTTILTGCHPAHHGVLNNAWWDRDRSRQVVTESEATWHEAMQWLWPGVETIHQALKRARPGAVSYSVNEPADCGADYSTFEVFREGRQLEIVNQLIPNLAGPFPLASQDVVTFSSHCGFATIADTLSLEQARGLWSGSFDGSDRPLPDFCWVNLSLTDAAFHDTGPHSDLARTALADTDARIGAILDAVDAAGALEETAVIVTADHGMEEADENLTGGWHDALAGAGLRVRDEAGGFLYLGV